MDVVEETLDFDNVRQCSSGVSATNIMHRQRPERQKSEFVVSQRQGACGVDPGVTVVAGCRDPGGDVAAGERL